MTLVLIGIHVYSWFYLGVINDSIMVSAICKSSGNTDTLPLPAGDLRMQAPPVSWRPPLIEPLFPSIRIDRSGRPTRIYVINNIILQVGGYVNVTNGQAWIWSPYPNCYLDARTLSFPMPR